MIETTSMSLQDPDTSSFDSIPELQATCYLLGEMSADEARAYEEQLADNAAVREEYQRAIQLLVAIGDCGASSQQQAVKVFAETNQTSRKARSARWLKQISLLAGFSLMFLFGLLAGRFSMPEREERLAGMMALNQQDQREVRLMQNIPATSTPQLAAAWFDLQSQSQGLSVSILDELETLEVESEEIAELEDNEDLPFWLVAGLALQQESHKENESIDVLPAEEAL